MEVLNGSIGVIAPFAKMYPEEQALIQAPLSRIISRMSPSTQAFMQTWADPATVITGLVLWALRVRHDILAAQAILPKREQPIPQASQETPGQPAHNNGPSIPTTPDVISNFMGQSII